MTELRENPKSTMSNEEFDKISRIIDKELGIKMPYTKKIMLESRLQKRLRILGLMNFTEYLKYLNSDIKGKGELVEFRNMVTTNKTDFFRENNHFEYMKNTLLPQWIQSKNRCFKVWSCACSSGEEPYTLAIVLEEFRQKNPGFEYKIVATDISTRVLAKAKEGIYSITDVSVIEESLRKKYFLRGKKERVDTYKIKDYIKENITFGKFNLMSNKYLSVPGPFDVIFCRNVLIYFDRDRQSEILTKLLSQMDNDGALFLGHSESMAGMNLQLKASASSVYKRVNHHG